MIDDRDLHRHLEEGGADLWDPPTPPPLDLAAITGEAPAPYDLTPVRRHSLASRLRGRILVPSFGLVAGGMACVALGLGLGAVVFSGEAPAPTVPVADVPTPAASTPLDPTAARTTPQQRVVLRHLDASPAQAVAVATVFSGPDGSTVDVTADGLPPLRSGRFYELWALGTKGRMVSIGTFTVDGQGHAQASMSLPVSLKKFPVLDVSVERPDGDPTHSGKSLLRAPV